MKKIAFLIVIALLQISGCKTYRKIENLSPPTFHQKNQTLSIEELNKLKIGDKISIETSTGKTLRLVFDRIEDAKLIGHPNSNESNNIPMEVPIKEITSLKVKRTNALATASLPFIGFGLFFIGYIIAFGSQ